MATGQLVGGGGEERGLKRKVQGGSTFAGWTHPYYWAPFILLGNGR